MATKAITKADLDKDVQSLMELQEKLSMHAGMSQMVGLILEAAAAAQL
jgi:hypothetical protein